MSKNKCILAHRQKSALSLQQRLLVPAPVQSRLYKSVQHCSITRKEKNKPISSYQLPGLYNGFLDDCLPDCKSTAGVPQASFTPGTRHPQPCLV